MGLILPPAGYVPKKPDIHIPAIAPRYRISEAMWEDLLCDPVMAANVLCHANLDAFQAARLRYYHWVPRVNDSSGFSSMKTKCIVLWVCIRQMLMPERHIGIYYFSAGQGRNTFWVALKELINQSEILAYHIDELSQDSAVHKIIWKNGGYTFLPAPSFARDAATQSSMRYHDEVIEEWTHIDASSEGINAQLLGRATMATWNQNHPIWTNHMIFSAPAKTRLHPAFARFSKHQKFARNGNPNYVTLHYSHKDYSNLPVDPRDMSRALKGDPDVETFITKYRNSGTISALKVESKSRTDWLAEGLGIWGADGKGWFTEEALLRCQQNGQRRNVIPVTSRQQYEDAILEHEKNKSVVSQN